MEPKIYANFKKYDKYGRRLAIFGWLEELEIKVLIISCSVMDQFSRKVAWAALEQVKAYPKTRYHPVKQVIPITDLNIPHAHKHFIQWCNDTYYTKHVDRAAVNPQIKGVHTYIKSSGDGSKELVAEYLIKDKDKLQAHG